MAKDLQFEMIAADASSRQKAVKDARVREALKLWESKNGKRAVKGAAMSSAVLTLAACGGGSSSNVPPGFGAVRVDITPDNAVPGMTVNGNAIGAIIRVADIDGDEYDVALINAFGSVAIGDKLIFDFTDFNDVVILDGNTIITGFSIIQVIGGTVDFTALGGEVLTNVTVEVGSKSIFTLEQFLSLDSVAIRDGATAGEIESVVTGSVTDEDFTALLAALADAGLAVGESPEGLTISITVGPDGMASEQAAQLIDLGVVIAEFTPVSDELTEGTDTLEGRSGDEMFTGTPETMTVGDSIDGKGGFDVFRVEADTLEFNVYAVDISNVERLEMALDGSSFTFESLEGKVDEAVAVLNAYTGVTGPDAVTTNTAEAIKIINAEPNWSDALNALLIQSVETYGSQLNNDAGYKKWVTDYATPILEAASAQDLLGAAGLFEGDLTGFDFEEVAISFSNDGEIKQRFTISVQTLELSPGGDLDVYLYGDENLQAVARVTATAGGDVALEMDGGPALAELVQARVDLLAAEGVANDRANLNDDVTGAQKVADDRADLNGDVVDAQGVSGTRAILNIDFNEAKLAYDEEFTPGTEALFTYTYSSVTAGGGNAQTITFTIDGKSYSTSGLINNSSATAVETAIKNALSADWDVSIELVNTTYKVTAEAKTAGALSDPTGTIVESHNGFLPSQITVTNGTDEELPDPEGSISIAYLRR